MREYIICLFVSGILVLCAGLLFLEGKHSEASVLDSKMHKKGWIWPADGVISDTYGTRQGKHKGIDIAGSINNPIYAVDDGIVEKSYYSNSYGNVIFIHHPSNYVTVYAHLNSRLADEGQEVRQGQMIGRMGRSGQATGVHLHFETHQTEWTYDKKFALDPEGLLGIRRLGEVVQAGKVSREENALEASTRFRLQEESGMHRKIQRNNTSINKYVVQKGDTLSAISKKNKQTVTELKRKNNLSSDIIKPGQILIIH